MSSVSSSVRLIPRVPMSLPLLSCGTSEARVTRGHRVLEGRAGVACELWSGTVLKEGQMRSTDYSGIWWGHRVTWQPIRDAAIEENTHYIEVDQNKLLLRKCPNKHSHCTMRLSIELENFQILKSKGLVFAQYWSKCDNSSDDWSKTGQNLKEKYSHHIFIQN